MQFTKPIRRSLYKKERHVSLKIPLWYRYLSKKIFESHLRQPLLEQLQRRQLQLRQFEFSELLGSILGVHLGHNKDRVDEDLVSQHSKIRALSGHAWEKNFGC